MRYLFDPCIFFYFEVIFHMIFQFGTKESAGCGQIHRNNSALVLDRNLIEAHIYLIWPYVGFYHCSMRSYEVFMWFYGMSIKYQSWIVSVNLSTSTKAELFLWICPFCEFVYTKLKLHVEDDLEIKKKCRDQIRCINDPCMQKFES